MSEDKYQLYEVRSAWIWTTTSEVCSSVRDGTHDTPKYVEEGIPLITSKNLINYPFSTYQSINPTFPKSLYSDYHHKSSMSWGQRADLTSAPS